MGREEHAPDSSLWSYPGLLSAQPKPAFPVSSPGRDRVPRGDSSAPLPTTWSTQQGRYCYLALKIEHSSWTFMVLGRTVCSCPLSPGFQFCLAPSSCPEAALHKLSRPLSRDLDPGISAGSPRKCQVASAPRSAFLLTAPTPGAEGHCPWLVPQPSKLPESWT